MKKLSHLLVLLLCCCPWAAHAVNVAEGPDFPNSASGTATVLTAGDNVFSGTIKTPNDIQDRFKVTVPAGMVINSISRTFSESSDPALSRYPMQGAFMTFNLIESIGVGAKSITAGQGPGTYEALVNANYAVGNAWSMTFNLGALPPNITSVVPPADGAYNTGEAMTFTVNFSGAVNVTGTPRLALTIGTTTRYVTYLSGNGTAALTFKYTVVAGDLDSDGLVVTSPVDLNGGTIKAVSSGPAATLTFTAPAMPNVTVNALKPNNANLTALTTTAGALTPTFAGGTITYSASVATTTTSITVTPTKADPLATAQVRINGGAFSTVAGGSASGALALNVGVNTVEVKVTSKDATVTKIYTLTVSRSPGAGVTVVLDPAGKMQLQTIAVNQTRSPGTRVKDFIETAGPRITVFGAGTSKNIAVTAVDNANGTWQYALNGTTWTAFVPPSATAARLLKADVDTRMRFVPNAGFTGTATISFKGWDGTGGAEGTVVDTSTAGIYSSSVGSATVRVAAAYDRALPASAETRFNERAATGTAPTDTIGNTANSIVFQLANGNLAAVWRFTADGANSYRYTVRAPDFS
ncbi:MAG: hypothetical protein RL514_2556 [Verrucomicrobiota bacterium]|jgi:hypothetical protein